MQRPPLVSAENSRATRQSPVGAGGVKLLVGGCSAWPDPILPAHNELKAALPTTALREEAAHNAPDIRNGRRGIALPLIN